LFGLHLNDLLVLGIPKVDALVAVTVGTADPNHVAVVRLRVVRLQDLVGPLQLILLFHLVDARRLVVFILVQRALGVVRVLLEILLLVDVRNAHRAVLAVQYLVKDFESLRHS
jgi:hypothetical protein